MLRRFQAARESTRTRRCAQRPCVFAAGAECSIGVEDRTDGVYVSESLVNVRQLKVRVCSHAWTRAGVRIPWRVTNITLGVRKCNSRCWNAGVCWTNGKRHATRAERGRRKKPRISARGVSHELKQEYSVISIDTWHLSSVRSGNGLWVTERLRTTRRPSENYDSSFSVSVAGAAS